MISPSGSRNRLVVADDLQEASSSDVRFLTRGMDLVESSDDIDKDGAS